MLWDRFDLATHVLHLALGFGAAGAALTAIATRKGGRLHKQAGWVFTAGMIVAAVTAWIFMLVRPLPLAMIEATLALYALGTAVLVLNPQWPGARKGEMALLGLLLLVMLGVVVAAMRLYLAGSPLLVAPVLLVAILAFFAVLDVRYLRSDHVARIDRVRRHALRMALAVSETARAPLITFADDLGVPVPAIVFGTFLLVPLIYYGFAPRSARPAAKATA